MELLDPWSCFFSCAKILERIYSNFLKTFKRFQLFSNKSKFSIYFSQKIQTFFQNVLTCIYMVHRFQAVIFSCSKLCKITLTLLLYILLFILFGGVGGMIIYLLLFFFVGMGEKIKKKYITPPKKIKIKYKKNHQNQKNVKQYIGVQD